MEKEGEARLAGSEACILCHKKSRVSRCHPWFSAGSSDTFQGDINLLLSRNSTAWMINALSPKSKFRNDTHLNRSNAGIGKDSVSCNTLS